MAKKFGGEYSPHPKSNSSNAATIPSVKAQEYNPKTAKAFRRLRLYRGLAFPIGIAGLLSLLGANPIAGLVSIASFLGILLTTEIVKAGVEAEAAFHERVIARAPAFPRKTIGAVMMGLIFFIETRFGIGADWIASIGVGVAGLAGMLMAFGLDPMRSKGLAGQNRYAAGRTAEAIEKAQGYLNEMRECCISVHNFSLIFLSLFSC